MMTRLSVLDRSPSKSEDCFISAFDEGGGKRKRNAFYFFFFIFLTKHRSSKSPWKSHSTNPEGERDDFGNCKSEILFA